MTIRAGRPWGEPIEVPAGLRIVADDRSLAELAATASPGPVRPRGGDLARTLGIGTSTPVPPVGEPATLCPVDVGWATTAAGTRPFAAHCVARRSWWSGEVLLVMNAQYIGSLDVAPRSHPNDGRLDIVEVDAAMPIGQRWKAVRRARRGAHLPHPSLTTSRLAEGSFRFGRPRAVWLDGRRWCTTDELVVRVGPDALLVVV